MTVPRTLWVCQADLGLSLKFRGLGSRGLGFTVSVSGLGFRA